MRSTRSPARFTLLLLFGMAASTSAIADKDCGLSVTASSVSIAWNLNYNFQSVTLTVLKSDNKACDFAVGFTRGGATDYSRRMTSGANLLAYQLYKDSSLTQILKDSSEAQYPANLLTGSFPKGKNLSQTLTYYVQIPPDSATTPAIRPSGSYQDTFSIRVYNLDNNPSGFDHPDDSKGVTISTSISKIIDISLVSAGAAFDAAGTSYSVNFGSLSTPQSKAFDLRVRTNAGYRIQFSSQNGGALKQASTSSKDSIPYTLTVDSAQQSLGGAPVTVATGAGQTNPEGVARAVSITTGDATQTLAGQYSDFITVTASTTE